MSRDYPPTHRFAGSSSARQSIGDPGHCERCAEVGHVKAHPDLGCGDVGCDSGHGDREEQDGADHVLEVANRLMTQILAAGRMLTPEGWDLARRHALLDCGWHTSDTQLIADVRLISMRGGPRYKP